MQPMQISPASPAGAASSSSLDASSVGRPAKLESVAREAWLSWAFVIRPYIHLLGLFTPQQLQQVERATQPFTHANLDSSFQRYNQDLWYLLTQFLGDTPLKILRRAEDGNGLEAWRQLAKKCNPEGGTSQTGALNKILHFKFGDSFRQFGYSLLDFDVRVMVIIRSLVLMKSLTMYAKL